MDYRILAMDELRHINELQAAEQVCRDRLEELNAALRSVKIPTPQADPVQGGGSRTEDRWLNIIAAQTDEESRLKQIRQKLKRFHVAWDVMSERDKAVLNEWYIVGGNGCAERVASREHCEIRTAFRWRDEAVIRFARVFYGSVID